MVYKLGPCISKHKEAEKYLLCKNYNFKKMFREFLNILVYITVALKLVTFNLVIHSVGDKMK